MPGNFQVHAHVPQLEALERARVFCTHGGMNSTQEALYYGVPIIVIPQMFEQGMTAARVVQLGLGVALEREHVTAGTLRNALLELENEPPLRERVREMSAQFRSAGGYRKAADVLERAALGELQENSRPKSSSGSDWNRATPRAQWGMSAEWMSFPDQE